MEITLNNFRCHVSNTFKFPQTGLVHLYGESGRGKSTVLTSVCYALFGKINGKVKKPYSRCTGASGGTTVVLKFDDALTISRSSKPSKLVARLNGVDYEDDAGQSIIEKYIGLNYNEFLASSYIIQNQEMSIISLTPAEQLAFIEHLVSGDTNRNEIVKQKIKDLYKITQEKQRSFEVQLSTNKGLLKELSSSGASGEAEEVPKPRLSEEELQLSIEKCMQLISGNGLRSQAALRTIQLFEEQRRRLSTQRSLREEKERDKNRLTVLHTTTKKNYDELVASFDPERRGVVLEKINRIRRINEKKNIMLTLQELQETFDLELKQKKESLTKKIISIDDKIKFSKLKNTRSRKELLSEIKYILSVIGCTTIEQAIEKYTSHERKIHRHNLRDTTHCPHCLTEVGIIGKDIVEITSQSSNEDEASHLTLFNILRDDLALFEASPGGGGDPSRALFESDHAERELASLPTTNNFIETYKTKLKQFSEEEVSSLEVSSSEEEDEEALRTELQHLIITQNSITQLEAELAKLTKQLEACNAGETGVFTGEACNNGVVEIEISEEQNTRSIAESSECSRELCDLRNQLEELKEMKNSYKEYNRYLSQLAARKKYAENCIAAQRGIDDCAQLLLNLSTLEKLAREAEFVSYIKTLDTINEHAMVYLERMFDEPISVRLEINDTSSKLNMCTRIQYKGTEYDSIDELSGGEKQRCELAFLLAVNDMLQSKLLLLDECLNNLDAEVNTTILNYLKELCTDKLIIVISHEAVDGVFDHTIEV